MALMNKRSLISSRIERAKNSQKMFPRRIAHIQELKTRVHQRPRELKTQQIKKYLTNWAAITKSGALKRIMRVLQVIRNLQIVIRRRDSTSETNSWKTELCLSIDWKKPEYGCLLSSHTTSLERVLSFILNIRGSNLIFRSWSSCKAYCSFAWSLWRWFHSRLK